jgi:PAS domain S-box-containing protein
MDERLESQRTIATASSVAGKGAIRLRAWFLVVASCWTILMALMAGWDYREGYSGALAIAKAAAGDSIAKDLLYRRWAIPMLLVTYGGIWAIGILGLCVFRTRLQRHLLELKQSEDALRKQEEFMRVLLENQSDGVVACDAAMRLVLFNRTAQQWHGVDVRDVPPEQWSDYYTLYDAEGIVPLSPEDIPLVRAFRGEHVEQAGMAIRAKGQKTRYITASGEAFYDDAGHKLGAVATMRDVTERKQAEKALRENELHYEQVVSRISDVVWRYEVDGRGQFVAGYISPVVDRLLGLPAGTIDNSFDK